MRGARAGNAGVTGDPWKFILLFEHVHGPGDNAGREGQAVLSPRDLVTLLGAVPAKFVTPLDGEGADSWTEYKQALAVLDRIVSRMEMTSSQS
jgi:hypothetical protein